MDCHSVLLWIQNLIASLYLGTQSGPRNALGCVHVLAGKPASLLPMARWWATSCPGLVLESVHKPQADLGRGVSLRAIPAAKSLGMYILLAGEGRWRGDAFKARFPAPASTKPHPESLLPVHSLDLLSLSTHCRCELITPLQCPHILPVLQSVHVYLLSTSHLPGLGLPTDSRPVPH